MIIVSDEHTHISDLEFEIERLRRLADDLEQIRKGNHPNRATLFDAPLIDGWRLQRRPVACLSGKVLGHPRIGKGHLGITTEVFVFAPVQGYARTLSRYYKLGLPEGVPLKVTQ